MQYLIQKDLSSAIAIVVSPKDGTQPIFRITPEGMNVLKQCNEDQDKHHDHITDVTIYSECSVRLSKRKSVVVDMRSEECDRPSDSFNDSLPDIPNIDRLRRAENAARDSFYREDFSNVEFRKGVVPKGRPRKERGGAPTFKSTKPSNTSELTKSRKWKEDPTTSDNKVTKKKKTEEATTKKPRGRPPKKCHLCQIAFESGEDLVNCGNCSKIVHSDCWRMDGDSCTKKK